MPEETRVFDVARPGHSSPDATSKPIIVGHHPVMSDPMMRDEPASPAPSTQITVQDSDSDEPTSTSHDLGDTALSSTAETTEFMPMNFHDAQDSSDTEKAPAPPDESEISPDTSSEPEATEPEPAAEPAYVDSPLVIDPHHTQGSHVGHPKSRGGRLMPVILGLLLILVGTYLAIDSGLVKTSINLPFHVFKQKTAAPVAAASATQASKNQVSPALPSGFTEYKLADTDITFAAPSVWGQPVSTPDPGFSVRGGTNKTDGTYAYLVDFGTNKDVEIAVTSLKYLPAARGALYYDALQWCTGTSDGKIYLTTLHFSTANKVDTPTTTACDQGPVADATKLDSTTIVQLKTAGADGKVIGDLYTKNLTEPALPVFRVKDAAMTNGDNIKSLLGTVKLTVADGSNTNSTP